VAVRGERPYSEPSDTWPNRSAFNRRIRALLDIKLQFNERDELTPATLEFSPEAKGHWIRFHDEVERELHPSGDMADTRDVASKAAGNVARLAALFHLFRVGPVGTIELPETGAAARIERH
jgi:putative DNA primase/helicase